MSLSSYCGVEVLLVTADLLPKLGWSPRGDHPHAYTGIDTDINRDSLTVYLPGQADGRCSVDTLCVLLMTVKLVGSVLSFGSIA
jgi:hypothetical protein